MRTGVLPINWQRRLPTALRVAPAVLVALLAVACTSLSPTQDAPITPEEEARIGAAAHGEIVSQFGGAYREPQLNAYVDRLTQRLAQSSGRGSGNVRVTVLDSPVVNAFAAPGGFLYVTRGLLALANDEAELASVLAHELGHVASHHSTERQTVASRVGLLNGVLSTLSGSPYLAEALSLSGASYVAAYSRDQERGADDLGIGYAVASGYDPFAASTFLTSLHRHFELQRSNTQGERGADVSSLLSTHPSTEERIQSARARAFAVGDLTTGYVRNRDVYLDMIDGLPYAGNPVHGVIDRRTFSHPVLRFRFAVPEGFELINRNDAVLARGPEDAVIIFDGAELDAGMSLENHMIEQWGEGLDLHNVRSFKLNGMEAVGGETLHKGFGHELVVVRHSENVVYRFLFITRPMATAKYESGFRNTIRSFKRLSEREARQIQSLTLRVVEVKPRETVARVARRMAFDHNRVERFRVLNGLGPEQELEPGQRVKIVTH